MLWGPVARTSVGREHTRAPALSARVVAGPWSTISAQNSWPMTTSRLRSITRGLPERFEFSTKRSACLRACRSEPQIPQARVRTSTSPWPGSGVGTSATTRARLRMTAARMASASARELEGLDVDSRRARCVPHVLAHAHGSGHGITLGVPLRRLRYLRMLELVEGEIDRRARGRAVAPAADDSRDLLVVGNVDRVVPLVPLGIDVARHVHAAELEGGGEVTRRRSRAQGAWMDHAVHVADEGGADDLWRAALGPWRGIGLDLLVARALQHRGALQLVHREVLGPTLHRLVARGVQEAGHRHPLGKVLLVVPAVEVGFLVGGNVRPHHQESGALFRSGHGEPTGFPCGRTR